MDHSAEHLAREAVARLRALGDPARARAMAAYMRTQDPFFGVGAVLLRGVLRDLARLHPPRSQAEYGAQCDALWTIREREGRYLAVEWARRFKPFITLDALPLYERMVREGAWWDTVDALAAHLVGPLLLDHRETMKPVIEAWTMDPCLWIRRAALLAHLKHRDRTDEDQLFSHCLRLAAEKDFFIRKAIGWSLREYGKTRPEAVRTFLETHRDAFSGLSLREGMKRLTKA